MKMPLSEAPYTMGSGAAVNPNDTLVKLIPRGAGELCRPELLSIVTKCRPAMYKVRESRGDLGSIQIRRGASGKVAKNSQLAPQSRDTNNAAPSLSPAA